MEWYCSADEENFYGNAMKILLAADIFPPQSGGPATYIVALANALVQRGHAISIVSLNPDSDASAVHCPLFAVQKKNKLARYFEYFSLLYRQSQLADVVYAMGPVNAGLPALVAARLRRKKFVVKVVGDYAWEQGTLRYGVTAGIDAFQKKNVFPIAVQALRAIERLTTRAADCVIVPSEYLRQLVLGWRVRGDHASTICNAVQVATPVTIKKPVGERWIISAGRLVPWKGFATLIQRMPYLLERDQNIRLKIIGDGPDRIMLERQIIQLQLGGVVEILGNRSSAEVAGYLKAGDVFVLNSSYEGLSHVLLEAKAIGIPVLASAVGGNPEVLAESELFPYNTSMEIQEKVFRALFEPSETRAPSVLPARFALATMIDETERLLASLCNS